MSNARPAQLTTTDPGITKYIWNLRVGQDYIWHKGAFRLVTAVEDRTVRMGRYVLHSHNSSTVEAATASSRWVGIVQLTR